MSGVVPRYIWQNNMKHNQEEKTLYPSHFHYPSKRLDLQILCERDGQVGKDGNEENGHQAIVRYGSEQTENNYKVFLKGSKSLKLRTYY